MSFYVYVLENPAMDGLVKIGKTKDMSKRLADLFKTGVPFPFKPIFVLECQTLEKMDEVERKLHAAFRRDRVNSRREFFKTDSETIAILLSLLGADVSSQYNGVVASNGSTVITAADVAAADKSLQAKKPAIDLFKLGFRRGDKLLYTETEDGDPAVEAEVEDGRHVSYKGKIYFLTELVKELLGLPSTASGIRGTEYWEYNGENLVQIFERGHL